MAWEILLSGRKSFVCSDFGGIILDHENSPVRFPQGIGLPAVHNQKTKGSVIREEKPAVDRAQGLGFLDHRPDLQAIYSEITAVNDPDGKPGEFQTQGADFEGHLKRLALEVHGAYLETLVHFLPGIQRRSKGACPIRKGNTSSGNRKEPHFFDMTLRKVSISSVIILSYPNRCVQIEFQNAAHRSALCARRIIW